MRATLLCVVLAVVFGQQDAQHQQHLPIRRLSFVGTGEVPVKPMWALVELSVEVNSNQLKGIKAGLQAGRSGQQSGQQGGNVTGGATNTPNSSSSSSSSSSMGQGQGGEEGMKVREEAQHRVEFILNYLKGLDQQSIKRLQTREISFRPMFNEFGDDDKDDKKEEKKLLGYTATFGLQFMVKLDLFKDLIQNIVSEGGANRIESVMFLPDVADLKAAQLQALQLATQECWDQSNAVLKVFGIAGPLKLLSIREMIGGGKLRNFAMRRVRNFIEDLQGGDDDSNEGGFNIDAQDSIVRSRLRCKFDFDDGAINFQQVQDVEPITGLGWLGGGDMQKPGETKKPEEIKKPEESLKPGETKKPEETVKPGETPKPAETQKPAETPLPAVTQPGATPVVVTTPNPVVTPNPVATPIPPRR